MSRKRDKNARKKAVKKKRSPAPARSELRIDQPPPSIEPDWDADYLAPEEAPVVMERGGAMGAIRKRVTPGRGEDGTTLLTKRRSVPELMVWLAGACGVVWAVWKLYVASQGETP